MTHIARYIGVAWAAWMVVGALDTVGKFSPASTFGYWDATQVIVILSASFFIGWMAAKENSLSHE